MSDIDLSNVELHCIGYLSSAVDTLKRAKAIISLAKNNRENAQTLSACAIILLTAALEQGVKTRFSEAAEIASMETGKPFRETSPGRYLEIEVPCRTRVRSLARVLTDGRFQLDPKHSVTRVLDELIQMRNKLAHVDEP